MLSQLADCQIASMGGVEDALSALEFLMLGASVVQLGSAVLLGGYGRITRTVEDLEAWMRAHRYGSVEELRGIALDSLSPFEEILTRRLHTSLDSPCGQSCGEGGCPCVTACLDGRGRPGGRPRPGRPGAVLRLRALRFALPRRTFFPAEIGAHTKKRPLNLFSGLF